MKKSEAIRLLAPSRQEAARMCGVTTSAISQWPEELVHPYLSVVQAALYRKAHKLPHPPIGHKRKTAEA